MKTVRLNKLPMCNFCKKPAQYDAPTLNGRWAYMCQEHLDSESSPSASICGCKLERRHQEPDKGKVVDGDVLTTLEDLVVNDVLEIQCPKCDAIKRLEPDADDNYLCECGCTIRFSNPIY